MGQIEISSIAQRSPETVTAQLGPTDPQLMPQMPREQALAILRGIYSQVTDAVLLYSVHGALLQANDAALKEMRLDSVEQHPLLRSGIVVLDAAGKRLEQWDWPIFRAIRGETIVGCELTVIMPNMPPEAARRYARVDARTTDFDGLLTEPVIVVQIKDITPFKINERAIAARADGLIHEQALFIALLEILHVAVVITDASGRLVRANWAYRDIFGADVAAGDIETFDAFERFEPGTGRRMTNAECPLAAAIGEGVVTIGKLIDIRRPDNGALRHVSLSSLPIRNSDGEIVGGLAVADDMTDLRQAEHDARANAERLRLMVDGARDHAFCMLSAKGIFETWSAGGQRLKQYTASEAIGQPYSILFSRDDIAAGVPEELLKAATRDGAVNFRGWRYRRDGSRFWVDTVISAVFDERGLAGFAEVARDMTALRNSEEQLRLRDEALRAVSQGIVVVDVRLPDQPIVLISGGFSQLTGYTAEEAIGRNCRFMQPANADKTVVALLRDAINEGHEQSVEILNVRKDGTEFWNELFLSPIRDEDGAVEKYVGIIVDVTERRLLEDKLRQAQKMDALGRMASGISHDFNNILTIVNGNAGILTDYISSGDPGRAELDLIITAGTRAELLTDQLLAFSRQSALQPRNVSLRDVVLDMKNLLDSLVGRRITITFDAPLDEWPIWADRSQIEQVILNVIINARDAMPDGGSVRIVIANEPSIETSAADEVLLQITDTGHGMDPVTRLRAFEPFFSTKGSSGSGLGLATVFGVISQSGGSVSLMSAPGEGTTVDIRMARSAIADLDVQRAHKRAGSVSARRTATAIVAEDEPDIRRWIKRVLEKRGVRVLEARNGVEALSVAQIHNNDIDLLIADVNMPVMNGVTLAKALSLRVKDVKVLYITGSVKEIDTLPFENVLFKPFDQEALYSALRELRAIF